MEKKIQKSLLQKLSAFQDNMIEANGKNSKRLLEEQNCLVYYEDDICEIAGEIYYKVIVHFADIDSGNEVKASSFGKTLIEARANATHSLCGRLRTSKKETEAPNPKAEESATPVSAKTTEKIDKSKDNALSPTPARMPSEPTGGVPKGFTGFPK